MMTGDGTPQPAPLNRVAQYTGTGEKRKRKIFFPLGLLFLIIRGKSNRPLQEDDAKHLMNAVNAVLLTVRVREGGSGFHL